MIHIYECHLELLLYLFSNVCRGSSLNVPRTFWIKVTFKVALMLLMFSPPPLPLFFVLFCCFAYHIQCGWQLNSWPCASLVHFVIRKFRALVESTSIIAQKRQRYLLKRGIWIPSLVGITNLTSKNLIQHSDQKGNNNKCVQL